MSDPPGSRYRFVIAGSPSPGFRGAFPDLVASTDDSGHTVLEGPVSDPSQLAGIVCDFCYRNTWIVSVEALPDGGPARNMVTTWSTPN